MFYRARVFLLAVSLCFIMSFTCASFFIPQPREIIQGKAEILLSGPACIVGEAAHPRAYNALKQIIKNCDIDITLDQSQARTLIFLERENATRKIPALLEYLRDLPREGYVLDVRSQNKQAIISLAGADDAGTFYAVQTLRQLLMNGTTLRQITIRDYPGFTRERGLGEFFYGKPWSHEERLAAIRFMGATKMNFYMYAPKDDPYHRERWREDYPSEEMSKLKELIDVANDNFVTFSFAVSPGLTMKYSSDEDFEILIRKFEKMIAAGARNISLQLDDLGSALTYDEDLRRFKRPGEAHAFVINKVYDYLKQYHPDVGFSACGVMYYIAKPDEYTRTLGELVNPAIPLMWTGSDVVDNEIGIDEVYFYQSGIRRKPFISDNYPVNDFATNRLFMGPLTGRPRDLVYHVYPGFISNPMNQEEASKIPLATVADYAWNPYEYEPERSWNNAIRLVCGDKGFTVMQLFCQNNRSSVMEKRESIELTNLINEYFYARSNVTKQALYDYLQALANISSALEQTIDNKNLLREISPWSAKLELYGKAALLAFEIQNHDDSVSVENLWNKWYELNDMMNSLRALPQEVAGGVIERLIYRTSVNGEGLGVTLLTPSTTYEPASGFVLNPLGSNALDFMVDGNPETFYIAGRSLTANDWIQVTMPDVRPVNSIQALLATPESPALFIYYGDLQYSRDLRTWTTLDNVRYPEIIWSSDSAIPMRAVRIKASRNQNYAPVIREFSVSVSDRPSISGTLDGLTTKDMEAICDGYISTAATTRGNHELDEYIELHFRDAQVHAGSVTLYMDRSAFCRDGVLELLTDDMYWKPLCQINTSAVRVPLDGKPLRAVRLRLLSSQHDSISIHEFSISDKKNCPY